ncbi:glutathione synthase/RimK-type ligase-like ATP-grasp enzyme [Paenibacillus castaneae]|uniref:YheC/YheD family protein n=1 Tax=Paenibacillus castaneae TaxID=474957 RepID=UPI001FB8ED39|nr:YheC/YheD family protein [Paenibacillus castaneae]NIK79305.1 glutathione synthase/RimK-type ligase-like ATP-grasp enzyme [Paenibacillus castaneae]
MTIQRVQSKWAKTKVMLKSDYLRQYMPDTKLFSHSSLKSMLLEYGMIYVKPINGTFGNGVIRVERTFVPSIGYRYQLEQKILFFSSIDSLYRRLASQIKNRRYIVQKGIHLLRHQKRRFDIRVMVQKNLNNKWEATGIIGRLAHPKKIVTNYHSGGTPMSIEMLMSDHTTSSELAAFKNKLRKLSLNIAHHLQATYPNIKEIGVDIAVDLKLHPWILEVNTYPDPFIFRKLNDQSVFHKIYRYAKAYGRFKKRSNHP